ncbi:MAG: putative quinol monooxygenase [Myxococcaceae bacterium]
MTASFQPATQPNQPMHAVAYLVSPEPEKRDELLQTLRSLVEEIRRTPGCLVCSICREEGGDLLVVVSGWQTRSDLQRHIRSEHFRILSGASRLLGASSDLGFLLSLPAEAQLT